MEKIFLFIEVKKNKMTVKGTFKSQVSYGVFKELLPYQVQSECKHALFILKKHNTRKKILFFLLIHEEWNCKHKIVRFSSNMMYNLSLQLIKFSQNNKQ